MIIPEEMRRCQRFFVFKANQWISVMAHPAYVNMPGHKAYAGRQADMWAGFVQQAAAKFRDVLAQQP